MKNMDDIVKAVKLSEVIRKKEEREEEKSVLKMIIIIGGIFCAAAAVAYILYRFLAPDCIEDVDDELDDEFDDSFFDEDPSPVFKDDVAFDQEAE